MAALMLGLAILGAVGVLGMFYALAVPRLQFRRAQSATLVDGIQVRLDRAGMETGAVQFVLRGATLGVVLGALAALAVGAFTPFVPFFLGGYAVLWVSLEDRRNQRVNRYHHDLATTMSIIVNAWKVRPALSTALEAVAIYGPGGGEGAQGGPGAGTVAADFWEILRNIRSGLPLRTALQQVADRRKSPIFDGLATALLVAEEQGTQAGAMLERQATITHRQVDTFNDALARQRIARGEVRNGTVGPWAILLMMQGLSLMGAAGVDTTFFRTPTGVIVTLAAALATLAMYVSAMRIAGRGLILGRVPTEHGRQ